VAQVKAKAKKNYKSDGPKHDFYIMDDIVYFSLKGRGTGLFAMVSVDKWPFVSKYEWYLGKAGYPICYRLRKLPLHKYIYEHILGELLPPQLFIDHTDRNKLNNVDTNLRLATPQENSFNRSTLTNKKGVKKNSDGNFSAVVVKNGTKHEIKNIPTEERAAEIYNIMAEELFGSFAAPNAPRPNNI